MACRISNNWTVNTKYIMQAFLDKDKIIIEYRGGIKYTATFDTEAEAKEHFEVLTKAMTEEKLEI